HVVIDGCSTDELIVVDDKNGVVTSVYKVFVGLWDDASHGLGIVTELIRPDPLWCGRGRFGTHNGVHHACRRCTSMVPVVVARLVMYPADITNGIDSIDIGAVVFINNDAVIYADPRSLSKLDGRANPDGSDYQIEIV